MKDPTVGDTIDRRYVLKREIARGGMGAVFEATHAFTGRAVAVKLAYGELGQTEESRERLLREACALAAVRHPNVVEVLDAGVTLDGEPYVVLEMLEGRTLEGILAARPRLGVEDVVHIGRQMCEALAFSHARGVIHRDLKPGNVFIARNEIGIETVKLFDFGIASAPVASPITPRKLTRAGELLGTPEYMAPEQLMAREGLDQRADIYATGMTLYECLTGDVPFTGSYPEILMKAMNAPVPPSPRATRSDVPINLSLAIERALSKDADDRFPDALSFAQSLVEATGLYKGHSSLLGSFLARAGVRAEPAPLRAFRVSMPEAAPSPTMTLDVSDFVDAVAASPRHAIAPTAAVAPAPAPVRPPVVVEPPRPPPLPAEIAQRRKFARAPYVTPARIVLPEGRPIDGRTEDVSEGGLLVVTEQQCKDGERVQVRFALPTTGKLVTVAATARWVRNARGRVAVGLEFIDTDEETRANIARYVDLMRPSMM